MVSSRTRERDRSEVISGRKGGRELKRYSQSQMIASGYTEDRPRIAREKRETSGRLTFDQSSVND